jgi:hypothetical protein
MADSGSPTNEKDLGVTTNKSHADDATGETQKAGTDRSEDGSAEPQPHVHAKTFLAVFAMCLIYFAQDFVLAGAGAVCPTA